MVAPSARGSAHGIRRVLAALLALLTAAALGIVAPPAAAAPERRLEFAIWNVCKLACPAPAPTWSVRRTRVARVISESGVDVLGINEATDHRYGGRTQWNDIRRLVASAGYVAPRIDSDRCARFGCEHTARLLFRKDTVRQLAFRSRPSSGSFRVRDIAPNVIAYPSRQVTWAYLEGLNGSGPFLAVSAHLTNDKSAAGEQHRLAFGEALTPWAEGMNAARGMSGVPIILMADLNSYDARQPRGVQSILREAGWLDALDAPRRRNADVNSVNYTPADRSGWPPRPLRPRNGRLANRIDYVLMRGSVRPIAYQVVVHLDGNGMFDPRYQASDHQMVRSRVAFTGTAAPSDRPRH